METKQISISLFGDIKQYYWILRILFKAFELPVLEQNYFKIWEDLIDGHSKTVSPYEYRLVKSTGTYKDFSHILKIKSPSTPETEAFLENLYQDIREQLARYDDYLSNAYESMCDDTF